MSKRDKMLQAWAQKPRPTATVETVRAILRYYFPDGFAEAEGTSHQLRVSHPALFGHPHFVGGTLSVPITNGQSVKPLYLKRIVEAIAVVQEASRTEDEIHDDTY